MKRIVTAINASSETAFEDEGMFSITEVVMLLRQIEELNGYDIRLEENFDGTTLLVVGDHAYSIII